jgi:hypothetical protein
LVGPSLIMEIIQLNSAIREFLIMACSALVAVGKESVQESSLLSPARILSLQSARIALPCRRFYVHTALTARLSVSCSPRQQDNLISIEFSVAGLKITNIL